MARPQTYTRPDLIQKTLQLFWHRGYAGTSIDDLVRGTGVSRHSLYKEFGGKKGALLQAIDLYQAQVVTPAFARVEAPNADIADIVAYFNHQIDAAEQAGLPGPGCLVANLTTETAPHDAEIRAKVDAHNARLRNGFHRALTNSFPPRPDDPMDTRADATLIFATGLWSLSRVTESAQPLKDAASHFIYLLTGEIA